MKGIEMLDTACFALLYTMVMAFNLLACVAMIPWD